jgi:hypothetical protein
MFIVTVTVAVTVTVSTWFCDINSHKRYTQIAQGSKQESVGKCRDTRRMLIKNALQHKMYASVLHGHSIKQSASQNIQSGPHNAAGNL